MSAINECVNGAEEESVLCVSSATEMNIESPSNEKEKQKW